MKLCDVDDGEKTATVTDEPGARELVARRRFLGFGAVVAFVVPMVLTLDASEASARGSWQSPRLRRPANQTFDLERADGRQTPFLMPGSYDWRERRATEAARARSESFEEMLDHARRRP